MKQLLPSGLEPHQAQVLTTIAQSLPSSDFYFSGGTALSAFHLHHRRSEDLDFFAEQEFDSAIIINFLKKHRAELGYQKLDFQTSFNRFLIQLHFADKSILKTEFTYYPFPRIQKKYLYFKLAIDSLVDIGTNKMMTIAQKPRSRDFLDLYFILQTGDLTFKQLYDQAKVKFDWHIDPVQLCSQFSMIDESDFGMLNQPLSLSQVSDFLLEQTRQFEEGMFKK